ncbi:hypothetical protein [Streptomyces sp. NPDC047108]|uniref:hypothetical protein n=1 Tax=Streptomyces sp. NPDC047108 TaxID=3155025 RepID=UPI0033CB4E54
MQRIGRATLVALAVAGMASAGPGIAFADGPGATATASGGNGAAGGLLQQNTAQQSRQNNTCGNHNSTILEVAGGRSVGRCAGDDTSLNERVLTKGGGAHADGGSSGADVLQRNTAQKGRQNNDCDHSSTLVVEGGRVESRCVHHDRSRNHRTLTESGGAHSTGGAAGPSLFQQNTAQEGRQNASCAFSGGSALQVDGGRLESRCITRDLSRNDHSLTKSGGARAAGGGGATGIVVVEDNVAQEGRQNNACDRVLNNGINVTGGGVESRCAAHDLSRNRHTLTKSGGAHTTGGAGAGFVSQQNTAQSGRQNNACARLNSANIDVDGGRVESRCASHDSSRNDHTLTRGGGAHSTGGNASADLFQQNTAQEGRQNNACADLNRSFVGVDGGRAENRCAHDDRSRSVGTAEISGGAEVEGGSSTAALLQQNTAQEGRQNNACGNLDNTTLSATGSRSQAQCRTVDTSTSIRSVQR